MSRPILTLFAAAALALGGTASAADYSIDASHSQVGFSVSHMTISTVRGQFTTFQGIAKTDAKGKLTAFEGTVDIASVNTEDAKRDGHLQSPDFFDGGTHPKMNFKSTKIKGDNSNGYKVTGDMTIHGITKSITLDMGPIKGPVTDPWGNVKAGTSATTVIDRQDFGLSWSKSLDGGGLVVGDDVTIQLELELLESK